MEFKCSKCNYVSRLKHHLTRHVNKKNKCGENPQIVEIPIELKCNGCNKTYSSETTLKRHLKICKATKIVNDNNEINVLDFNEDCLSFIYILKEREFVKTKESIFKIGYTTRDIGARSNGYPKGSKIYLTLPVMGNPEAEFIELFKKNFTQRTDIGTEYFEGNFKEMYTQCLKKVIN